MDSSKITKPKKFDKIDFLEPHEYFLEILPIHLSYRTNNKSIRSLIMYRCSDINLRSSKIPHILLPTKKIDLCPVDFAKQAMWNIKCPRNLCRVFCLSVATASTITVHHNFKRRFLLGIPFNVPTCITFAHFTDRSN